jgi:hypothetical protein
VPPRPPALQRIQAQIDERLNVAQQLEQIARRAEFIPGVLSVAQIRWDAAITAYQAQLEQETLDDLDKAAERAAERKRLGEKIESNSQRAYLRDTTESKLVLAKARWDANLALFQAEVIYNLLRRLAREQETDRRVSVAARTEAPKPTKTNDFKKDFKPFENGWRREEPAPTKKLPAKVKPAAKKSLPKKSFVESFVESFLPPPPLPRGRPPARATSPKVEAKSTSNIDDLLSRLRSSLDAPKKPFTLPPKQPVVETKPTPTPVAAADEPLVPSVSYTTLEELRNARIGDAWRVFVDGAKEGSETTVERVSTTLLTFANGWRFNLRHGRPVGYSNVTYEPVRLAESAEPPPRVKVPTPKPLPPLHVEEEEDPKLEPFELEQPNPLTARQTQELSQFLQNKLEKMKEASREGKPALEGIITTLEVRFAEELSDPAARPVVNDMVRKIMIDAGYTPTEAKRVHGVLFTVGMRFEPPAPTLKAERNIIVDACIKARFGDAWIARKQNVRTTVSYVTPLQVCFINGDKLMRDGQPLITNHYDDYIPAPPETAQELESAF